MSNVVISSCARRYPFSLLLAVVIVLLSLLPMPEVKAMENVPLADKWTHMVMYGSLTLTIWLEYLRRHRTLCARRLLAWAFLAPIAMGGTLELLQAYCTTCRSGEWLDFVANSIGVCLGTAAGMLLHRFRPTFLAAK